MASRKPSANTIARAAAAAASAAAAMNDDSIDLDELGEGDESEILEALESLDDGNSGVTWELYCTAPFDKQGLVRRMVREELRTLRDEILKLGPGTYQLKARSPRGRYIEKSSKMFKVSGLAVRNAEPASSSPARAPLDPMLLMQQLEEKIEKRAAAAKAEKWETIKLLTPFLAPAAVELVKSLFGNRGGGGVKELVEALAVLKGLQGGDGSDKAIEAMFKGIELARDMGGADGKGRSWPDLVLETIREISPVAKSIVDTRAAAIAATSQQPPTPAPALLPAAAANGHAAGLQGGTLDPRFEMAKPLLNKLANDLEDFAGNAAHPDLTAESLWAKVPMFVRSQVSQQQLLEWLNSPDWWQHLATFRPTLQAFQNYCNDVRLSFIKLLEDEPDEVDAGGTDPQASAPAKQ
jgi:hypothetical protein